MAQNQTTLTVADVAPTDLGSPAAQMILDHAISK
jgi:hypothetical protein